MHRTVSTSEPDRVGGMTLTQEQRPSTSNSSAARGRRPPSENVRGDRDKKDTQHTCKISELTSMRSRTSTQGLASTLV